MFGFRKRRQEKARRQIEAYEAGKRAGEAILGAVGEFIQFRLNEISPNYLNVFSDRLKTIGDEKDHEPKEVAKVELQIFIENLLNLPSKLRSEARERIKNWFDLAIQVEIVDKIDEYIDKLVKERIDQIYMEAAQMTDQALADLAASRSEDPS